MHVALTRTSPGVTTLIDFMLTIAVLGLVVLPLWQTIPFMSLLGFRVLMVSTMAEVYAHQEVDGEFPGLSTVLTTPDPRTGKPPMSFASGIALLLYFVYALLCLSTVAVIKRETGGWKWPIFMVGYMGVVAWVAAYVGFLIAS